jgi:hypothetical protein
VPTEIRAHVAKFGPARTQPNRAFARLNAVIADPTLHTGRRLALELLVRAAAIALAAIGILGILPAVARAFG